MSFLSRFFKPQPEDDDPLQGLDDTSAEDEGLFIGGEAQSPQQGAGGPVPSRPETAESEEADADADVWPEAAGSEAAQAAEPPAAEPPAAEPEGPQADEPLDQDAAPTEPSAEEPQEEAPSAPDSDDPLSMFRSSARDLGATELTKGLEDIPIDDVLNDLREVRGMLADPMQRTNGKEEAA